MCGIVGYVGGQRAAPLLRDGLRRLEYRGYDSAGLAVAERDGLKILRSLGKLRNLDALADARPLDGSVGLGHTRWATHGRPSVENAHPHTDCTRAVAVVHNGIIENYGALKAGLLAEGHRFASETDTEVLAHLVEEELAAAPGGGPEERFVEAVRRSLLRVRGAYALAILWSELPDVIVAAKTASPLVIGLGEGETFVASDVPAFLERTRTVLFLEDGEMAALGARRRAYFTLDGRRVEKTPVVVPWDAAAAQKAGYPHFMLKEIHEQPQALADTLRGRLGGLGDGALEREAGLPAAELARFTHAHVVACGTAYHAGIVGKYLLERWARLPTQVEVASEFRYRRPLLGPSCLLIAVSQSGETADTLAAARLGRESGAKVLAVSNTVGSAVARAADYNLYTRCGPECGVASTKAFAGQLAALNVLALHAAVARGTLEPAEARAWADALARLPELAAETLALADGAERAARRLKDSAHCLFLGRGLDYPTALEGALKLKEISYIHAEGYAAGEMKHGPIALIDEQMPVVAIATRSETFEKMLSNVEEARARGARLLALCTRGEARLLGKTDDVLELPPADERLAPVLNTIPLQLLAYYAARLRGCDIDQPRNLAKSVTVE